MSILRWLTGPPKPNSPTPRSEPGTVPSSRSDQKSGLAAYSAADDPALFERIHALALAPTDFEVLTVSGICQVQQGRFAEAEISFRRAISADSEQVSAWTN